MFTDVARAEPQGTVVTGGAVDISRSGTHTEFRQHSQTALLNHRSFDIGANESVNFAQPSANALAVNRVVGSDLPTSIAGKLTANGNVWVLNPSGVAIRGTAQVNVGGLLATTASISDEDILAGKRSFAGAPAGSAVTNAGSIEAGQGGVVLVAPVVSNSGSIATRGSDVALGAGSGFTVDFDGDGLTRFEVSPGSDVSLTNAGTISAEGGAAYISAASADAVRTSVVSIGGRVEATRAENRGGVIVISGGDGGVTEIAGTLDAAQVAGAGGRIAVTGDRVDIASSAVLDASGAGGGGGIEIGGGLRGAPIASPVLAWAGAPNAAPAAAPLPTAKRTVVREGARITANAGAEGDGGSVIVWADEATGFRGAIEARGGTQSGDGGFAEVSGRQGLVFDGTVDLTAAKGATGALLLDPDNVTIVAGAAPDDNLLLDRVLDLNEGPSSSTISAGAVAASVLSANTLIEAKDTITQQADVTLSGSNSLTYRTLNGDITLNAALTGPGNGLTLEAGGDVTLGALAVAALQVTADDISVLAALDITGDATFINRSGGAVGIGSGAGSFRLDGVELGLIEAGRIVVDSGDGNVAIASVTLDEPLSVFSGAGDVGVAGLSGTQLVIDAGGALTFADAGSSLSSLRVENAASIGQNAAGAVTVSGTTFLNAAGDIALDLASNNFASVDLAGDTVALRDSNALQLGTVDAAELTVSAGGAISQRAGTAISVPGDSGISTTAGAITLTRTANDFANEGSGHSVLLSAPGAVSVTDANSIALGTISTGANLTVRAGGGIADTPGAAIAVGGTTDLTAQTGAAFFDIALDNPTHDFFGPVNARGATVVLSDASAIALGAIDASNLTVAAAGRITDVAGQSIRVAGASDLTAQSGGVLFDIVLDASGAPSDRPHDFATVSARGASIVLHDANAITLGPILAGANLTVRAGGGITDTPGAAVVVGGTADLTAQTGAAFFDIALDNPTHDFFGPVNARGATVVLSDASAIALGAIDASDLMVSAGGPITDVPGGSIRVPGLTGLTAESGGALFDIALDGSGALFDRPHDFGTVSARGATVALHDANAIALGTIGAANLTVSAGGSIIDTPGAAIGVGGTTNLIAQTGAEFFDIALVGDGAVPFDRPHDFGLVNARGEDIVLHDRNAVVLGAIDANESGQESATGVPDATIAHFDNDGDGLRSAAEPAASGDLTVRAGGAIADAGAGIDVEGRTRLEAREGAARFDIVLDGPNDFDSNAVGPDAVHEVDATGASIVLVDRNAIALGAISASGLAVTAGGSITDTPGESIVTATAELIAQSGAEFFDIALDGDGAAPFDLAHNFGLVSARGEDIVLHDRNAIVLGAIEANESGRDGATGVPDATIARYDNDGDGLLAAFEPAAAGDLTVRAGGAITDTGASIEVDGRTRLEAGRGAALFDITLDGLDGDPSDRPHNFDSNAVGPHAFDEVDAIGANVSLVDRDALALGTIRASNLTIGAGGSVTDTPGEAILASGTTDIVAQSGPDFFDIVFDNPQTHDFGSVKLTGEGVRLLDLRDLTIISVDSLSDGAPDALLPADGIHLEVSQGSFGFAPGSTAPLSAVHDITLFAPNGSFDADPDPAVIDQRMPDGLTFRSASGNITLDLQDGFVIEDVLGTSPFTLDAPNGISLIRIGEGGEAGERQFFGIGTVDFLEETQQPGFNAFFSLVAPGDRQLFRVTGDLGLIARAPLTVRIQNTDAVASTGAGTVIDGTTYLGGNFADGISMFGNFAGAEGEIASIEGFRNAFFIGELPYVVEESNTVNGCAILVPTACQPIGSLLPNLGYREGLLLGVRFVDAAEDLDDPFTNRGDEEGWE